MNIEELHQHFLASTGVCTDTRKLFKGCLFFALKGENFNGNTFAKQALTDGASLVIIDEKKYSQGEKTFVVKDVLTTLQKLANFHRKFLDLPILALTGSNGKTTSKELINVVLSTKFKTAATQGNLNNHIGVPLTLLSMDEQTEIGIVEMGANHQGEIAALCRIAEPDMGYITNFGKAHLEGFGGVEGVVKGKSELYHYIIQNDGLIFLDNDNERQAAIVGNHRRYTFAENAEADEKIQLEEAHPFVKVSSGGQIIQSQLTGTYNFTNIAAAICIGRYHDISKASIKKAIESYQPSNNRSQLLTKKGHRIILDAYNANPSSMEVALENFAQFEGRRVCFLGDMFELGAEAAEEHQRIADKTLALDLHEVFLLGKHFSATQTTSQLKYASFEALKAQGFELPENSTILIKGSRGMAMERILDLL